MTHFPTFIFDELFNFSKALLFNFTNFANKEFPNNFYGN